MKTVLVVEDDAFIREIIQEDLEEVGYQVIAAADADTAVAILAARADIGLVFTDIELLGSMNGLNWPQRSRWPPVHLIVTSGNERPPGLPADALFISKPYGHLAVVAAIRTFDGM